MSPEQSESSSVRRYVLLAIKIAVSVVLLALLFFAHRRGPPVGERARGVGAVAAACAR